MRHLLIIFIMITMIAGCAYPGTTAQVVDDRPSIAVQGAPKDAVLYVDDLNMGLADTYDGRPKVLLLEPGKHKIEIKSEGHILLSEKVFLGSGSMKTFSVVSPGSVQ